MKKTILIFLLIIFLQSTFSYTLKEGNTEEIEGRKITLVSLQQEKAIFQIDQEKNIINLGSSKEINGVIISLTDILYTGEEDSTASFNIELTYTCGDLTCNENEDSINCCQDCGCIGGERCTSSGCILPECFLDEDCNDNNDLTKNSCEDYKCKSENISCKKDSQCNDNNPDTDDFCNSGKCENLPPICKTDEDCKDTNPCTLDQCINRDCQYNSIEDCEDENKNTIKKEETPTTQEEVIKLTRDSDPSIFQIILNWIKNIFN